MARILPKPLCIKYYNLPLSGLESKMFAAACRPWNISYFTIGASNNNIIMLNINCVKEALRALKVYRISFNKDAKNRKRVNNIIKQMESFRGDKNDK